MYSEPWHWMGVQWPSLCSGLFIPIKASVFIEQRISGAASLIVNAINAQSLICLTLYIKHRSYICVYVCSPIARTDTLICVRYGMFIPRNQKKVPERSKLRKSVLISSLLEAGFCSSEKNTTKNCVKIKSFSKRRLQKQTSAPRKPVVCSGPCEDGYSSWEIKHDRTTTPQPNLFVSARRLQGQRPQARELSWVPTPIKKVFLQVGNQARQKKRATIKVVCFGGQITEEKRPQRRKRALGSSFSELKYYTELY